MVLFNYSTKELTAKIVYYGPGLCGKTTNLQFIHKNLPDPVRGKMLSLSTKTDRTLFFDFLPMDLGEIRGMKTRIQLYTVPGQVFYNETRKLVLKGADGVVFVADSQKEMLGPDIESFKNLEENLKGHGISLAEMPHVLQFNKRDLPKLSSIEEINAALNKYNAPFYESVATTGIGVQDTLKAITKLVLLHLTKKYDTPGAAAAAAAGDAREMPLAAAAAKPAAAPASAGKASSGKRGRSTVAVPAASAAVAAATATPTTPPAAVLAPFAADEIEDLMDEVGDVDAAAPAPVAERPSAARPVPSEIELPSVVADDDDFDLDLEADEPAPSRIVTPPTPPTPPRREAEVVLTEVAADAELFRDPSLEIARMAAGEGREIVVPVELGSGTAVKRFKLSLKLTLTPVD
jgi:signal recognition particle receptor subunit beta